MTPPAILQILYWYIREYHFQLLEQKGRPIFMIIVKTTQSMPAAAWEQVLWDALHCHIYRMFFLFVFDRYQIRHCRTVAIQQPSSIANPAMIPAVAIQQQSPVVATPATTPAAAIQQRPPAAAIQQQFQRKPFSNNRQRLPIQHQ